MDVDGLKGQNAYQKRRVQDAEEEADKKINAARERVKQETLDAEAKLSKLREDYSVRSDFERVRTEGSMANLQQKGYESIRDYKRRLDAEQAKIQNQSEKELADLNARLDQTRSNLESSGKKEILTLAEKNAFQKNLQEKTGKEAITELSSRQNAELELRAAAHGQIMGGLNNQTKIQQENLRQNSERSMNDATEHYESGFRGLVDHQNQSLSKLGRETKAQYEEAKMKSAHRLAAYSDRQNDPFYKLVDLKMKLTEKADHFLLTALVPEHEQKRIHVAVRGNDIVLSGQRRNEEKLDIGEGRYRSTSSYQSFHEAFPLNFPVDERNVTKRFEGDVLIVEIPKKNTFDPQKVSAKKGSVTREETVMAVRPNFPENLPGEKALAELIESSRPSPDKKT